jgi:hypothetical protein
MQPIDRSEKMTLRLTKEEAELRDALSVRLGVNPSGVMRMALLRLGTAEGVVPLAKEKPDPKGPGVRKK